MKKKPDKNDQFSAGDPPKQGSEVSITDLALERLKALQSIQDSVLSTSQSSELAEENEKEINYDAKNEALDYKIRLSKINSRKRWDGWLLTLVITGFIASYTMIVLIGRGILVFDNSTYAVPSVVAAGVIETYGLAKIAARYFFSDDNPKRKKKQT